MAGYDVLLSHPHASVTIPSNPFTATQKLMESSLNSAYLWRFITHLGAVGFVIPILALTATGLWQSHQRAVVRIWLLAITLAVTATMATKVLFFGWGLGIAFLNFTGLSGHTLLATSVLPVFFNWLVASDKPRFHPASAIFGLMVGVVVGVSRVVLGAHSNSEVIAAWILGAIVSWITLNTIDGPIQRLWFTRLSPFVLLLALGATTSNYLPTHDWEIELSLLLSGRDKPYTRHHLLKPPRFGNALSQTDCISKA